VSELLHSLKAEWDLAHAGELARVPLYHQIYSVLKESILNGTISYESQMPTEHQLAATFDVSRITAKRAMDELASENLIARFRGKGSHVTFRYTPQTERAPVVGMLENLAEMGKHSIVHVVSIEEVVPPANIRQRLELGERETVHKLVRISSNEDGEPYAYYVSWTVGITRGFTKENLETTLRLDVIRDNGIKLTKIEQVLGAENASARISEDLQVEPGAALLSIRRQLHNEDGKIIDVLDCLYNPKRFQYSIVLSLD